jgi:hypothetical protein
MRRKATWAVLLLLLVSLQSLAMPCGVRCAMSHQTAKVQCSMPGMEHCNGMSIEESGSKSGLHSIHAMRQCSSDVYSDDVAVMKDRGTVERTDVVLHTSTNVNAGTSAQLPALVQKAWPADRSTTVPSNLNPLISTLRI